MLTGKILALALLVVGLVAGVSVAVPALDQPDRPPSRAPLVVGGDEDRDRPDRGNGSPTDDQQARDGREDRDERDGARGDGRNDGDVSDSDDTVQVIRPRPGGGEVPDADDDDDDDDTDDDTDDSDDGDGDD